ncbi:sirohydrochlorin chelatase [Thalassospira mesophila]|uniref:sirohydrochlorin chelatase n=1 Tax=Thalassospira mesophila TaxID=1293891 RepID=UPI00118157F3|nr:CbiX/SirB N-terminal domain-containing protein [Thalassospira mesophila]
MPYRGKTTLLIVAHGTSAEGGNPAGELANGLRARWNGCVCHAYMRSTPDLASVLADLKTQGKAGRLVVVPLFFSEGYLVTEEMPSILADAGLHDAMVLPPVTGLRGFVPMVADHIVRALALNTWQAGETTLFLVPHGLKTLTEPLAEQVWLAQRIINVVPELSVRVANVEGAPSLTDWRSMTTSRNNMFLPLLAGGGVHARFDLPEMMVLDAAERAHVLAPLGTWGELPDLILRQAQKTTRQAAVLPSHIPEPEPLDPCRLAPS